MEPSTPLDYFEACLREGRSGLGQATVAVLGRTGAGKSTLVNAIFGEQVAATGTGAPVTGPLTEHRVQGAPLVLLDSPGLELGGGAAEDAVALIAAEVRRRAALGVAEALHVVWYCVDASTDRFEPAEVESCAAAPPRCRRSSCSRRSRRNPGWSRHPGAGAAGRGGVAGARGGAPLRAPHDRAARARGADRDDDLRRCPRRRGARSSWPSATRSTSR